MGSKFHIVITVFKYEYPFEKLRVLKNDILITKLSKNNSNKSNNKYYDKKSIFQEFIL